MSDMNLVLLDDSLDEVILHKIKNILKICVMKSFTDSIKYVSHSGRIDMTPQDWIFCLKYNALSFCKNIDNLEAFDNQYHNLLELYSIHNVNILDNNNSDSVSDILQQQQMTDDTDTLHNKQRHISNNKQESSCQCEKCVDMYTTNNIWDTIQSKNIIIETIKVNIDTIISQKFKKYIK